MELTSEIELYRTSTSDNWLVISKILVKLERGCKLPIFVRLNEKHRNIAFLQMNSHPFACLMDNSDIRRQRRIVLFNRFPLDVSRANSQINLRHRTDNLK